MNEILKIRPEQDQKDAPVMPKKRLFLWVFLVIAAAIGYGAYGHWRQNADAAQTQDETIHFVPKVRLTSAELLDRPLELTLPGETQAFDTASLFPRATGYIAERRVDIGSRVKKGDLLVRIAAPDLDRQLDQARAQLQQVEAAVAQAHALVDQALANKKLAGVTFDRTDALTKRGYETVQNRDNQIANVVSQQAAVETAQAGVKVAEANVEAQRATVERLRTLTEFENVVAPFDGVITVRTIDVGDLVNADVGIGRPMFTVDQDRVLRVLVNVPQNSAIGIIEGLAAQIQVAQIPDRLFEGKVARSSVALTSSARTLSVEIDVDNKDGVLRPGLFVNVTFAIPRSHPGVMIPAEALVFDQKGLHVVVVMPDHQVHLQPIKIYRDFGASVELNEGLQGKEQIVLSPPASLIEGAPVEPLAETAEFQAAR
jgi:RND family efflux transporter MFP subunit